MLRFPNIDSRPQEHLARANRRASRRLTTAVSGSCLLILAALLSNPVDDMGMLLGVALAADPLYYSHFGIPQSSDAKTRYMYTQNLNEIKVIKLPQLARFYVDIIKLSVTCNIITLILFGPPGERKPHHKPFSQIHNLKDQATIVVGRTSHEQPFPMTQTHTKSLGLSPIEHITQQSVRLVFIDLLLTMGRCQ